MTTNTFPARPVRLTRVGASHYAATLSNGAVVEATADRTAISAKVIGWVLTSNDGRTSHGYVRTLADARETVARLEREVATKAAEQTDEGGRCARCRAEVADMAEPCLDSGEISAPHLPAASPAEVARSVAEFGPLEPEADELTVDRLDILEAKQRRQGLTDAELTELRNLRAWCDAEPAPVAELPSTTTTEVAAQMAAEVVAAVKAAGIPSAGAEWDGVHVYTIVPEQVVELVAIATRHGLRVDVAAGSVYRLAP